MTLPFWRSYGSTEMTDYIASRTYEVRLFLLGFENKRN
ncbi:hypothetical protein HMPREF9412_2517 [Paenibacillus sp. HGF5]|nr:hypothetical protein HMPREF9412_2517 [Paenibacillus sp. HGF5]